MSLREKKADMLRLKEKKDGKKQVSDDIFELLN